MKYFYAFVIFYTSICQIGSSKKRRCLFSVVPTSAKNVVYVSVNFHRFSFTPRWQDIIWSVLQDVDLWALSDAWAAARAPGVRAQSSCIAVRLWGDFRDFDVFLLNNVDDGRLICVAGVLLPCAYHVCIPCLYIMMYYVYDIYSTHYTQWYGEYQNPWTAHPHQLTTRTVFPKLFDTLTWAVHPLELSGVFGV